MLQFTQLCRAAGCLAIVLGSTIVAWAQRGPASRPAVRPVRMQIREARDEAVGEYAFAIVGGAGRAGVYVSSRPRVPLAELLKAAGVPEDPAGPAVKIIRSQQPTSMQLQQGSNEALRVDLLEAGSVVILSPAANAPAPEMISVACLGLTDAPVVLHLDHEIRDLETLVRRLLQPAQLARSAQVVSAQGIRPTGRFVDGAVIFFRPSDVDRAALQQVPPFPGSVDLDQALAAIAAARPAITPVHERSPEQDPIHIQQLLQAPTLPLPNAQALVESPQLLQIPLPPVQLPVTRSIGAPADLKLPPRSPVADSPPLASAPLGPIVAALETTPQPLSPDMVSSLRLEPRPDAPLAEAVAATPQSQATAWWPMTLGVIVLAGLCMGLSVLWARWDAQQLADAIQRRATTKQEIPAAAVPVAALIESPLTALLQGALPMVEEPVQISGEWPLHGAVIGHRRMRIDAAHTEIAGPHFTREARSSRRKSLAGRVPLDERAFRTALRAGLTSTVPATEESASDQWEREFTPEAEQFEGDFSGHAVNSRQPLDSTDDTTIGTALEHAPDIASEGLDADGFDIVQPGDPLLHRQAKSALDRALRTLNREKQR